MSQAPLRSGEAMALNRFATTETKNSIAVAVAASRVCLDHLIAFSPLIQGAGDPLVGVEAGVEVGKLVAPRAVIVVNCVPGVANSANDACTTAPLDNLVHDVSPRAAVWVGVVGGVAACVGVGAGAEWFGHGAGFGVGLGEGGGVGVVVAGAEFVVPAGLVGVLVAADEAERVVLFGGGALDEGGFAVGVVAVGPSALTRLVDEAQDGLVVVGESPRV